MYQAETQIRVRYAETDQMGYVYYGNYAMYFEVARVEALRSAGFSYKKMEEFGIMMPVLEQTNDFHILYIGLNLNSFIFYKIPIMLSQGSKLTRF